MNNFASFSGEPVVIVPVNGKSDEESKKYREEGNKLYKRMDLNESIVFYNVAICYAKSKETLALAYGNRSAAYFSAERFQECIDNIKLARENGYPAEKMATLDEREEKCLQLLMEKMELKADQDPWNYLKLSYPANKKIPWIIEGLEMRRNEKCGRGIYSGIYLKPGDIVCVEDIPITYAKYEWQAFFKHCSNCMKMKHFNLIPCAKTASFMFCSTDCRDDFYKYADISNGEFDSFKFLLNKIEAAFGGREQLEKYMRDHKPAETSFFDFDFSNVSQKEKDLIIYKCFLSSVFPTKDAPAVCTRYNSGTNKLINKFLRIFGWNMVLYHHMKYGQSLSDIKTDNNARVYTTFFGLLNHSCVANVSYQFVDNKAVLFVFRPIKANDQLFFVHAGDIFQVGRQALISRMEFECECIACRKNLTMLDIKPEFRTQKIELLKDVKTVKEAVSEVSKNFKLIGKCGKPVSMECVMSQGNVVHLLGFIANKAMLPA